MKTVPFTFRVLGNCLEITPDEPIEDNAIYEVRLRNIKSKDGKKEYPNQKFEITTAMTPMYCSVDEIKMLVDVFDIPESIILMMIRRASKEADFINGKPVDISNGIPFEVEQFVAVKASLLSLLRAYAVSGSESGLEGTLGKITFKNGDELSSIKALLDRLRDAAKKWQEAIRGYVFEGRNVSKFALRGNRTLRPTPAYAILDDWTRNGNLGLKGRELI